MCIILLWYIFCITHVYHKFTNIIELWKCSSISNGIYSVNTYSLSYLNIYQALQSYNLGIHSSISNLGENMRIKNGLEFQIGRHQLRMTCFGIILTEVLAEVWMSKHVSQDYYLPIWNKRLSLILFLAEYWE